MYCFKDFYFSFNCINMRKLPIISFGVAILCFLGLQFVPRKPATKGEGESKQGRQELVELGIEDILNKSKSSLDSLGSISLKEVESTLVTSSNDIKKETEAYKGLSKFWNEHQNYTVGAHYAEQVAQIEQTNQAWSIAGTTFGMAVNQRNTEPSWKLFAAKHAIQAFDKALSINPQDNASSINKALVLVELSMLDPTVPPMKGIGILKDLVSKDSTNVSALAALGDMALRRNGFEDASKRYAQITRIKTASARQRCTAFMQLAYCQSQLGASVEANQSLKNAADEEFKNSKFANGSSDEQFSHYFILADLYFQLGDHDNAILNYQKALPLASNEATKKDIQKQLSSLVVKH
jgi:tetratricopeptide (TPR) repeat protein